MPRIDEDRLCSNCGGRLQDKNYVICAECPAASIKLCYMCFSHNIDLPGHRNTHDYKVCTDDPVLFPSPQEQEESVWSASTELKLLQAAEFYSLGWIEMQKSGLPASPMDLKQHYEMHYIEGRIGAKTAGKAAKFPLTVVDRTGSSQEGSSASCTIDTSRKDEVSNSTSKPSSADSFGCYSNISQASISFMPLRRDFDCEYLDGAEQQLKGLLILPDDDETERAILRAKVDAYVRVVQERQRRKQVIFEHNKVALFLKENFGSKTTRRHCKRLRHKSLVDKCKRLLQFMTNFDNADFLNRLIELKLVKSRIKQLQRYRRNAITVLEEGIQFDKERKQRRKNPTVDTDDKHKVNLCKKPSLLSGLELTFCDHQNLSSFEYLVLKATALHRYQKRALGIPSKLTDSCLTPLLPTVEMFLYKIGIIDVL